jgi:hypothetical protein
MTDWSSRGSLLALSMVTAAMAPALVGQNPPPREATSYFPAGETWQRALRVHRRGRIRAPHASGFACFCIRARVT